MATLREIDKFLDGCDRPTLKQVKSKVEARLEAGEAEDRQKAIEVLAAQAKDMGFDDIKDLFGLKSQRQGRGADGTGKRAPAKIKYQNPKVSSENWTGRGRAPNWLVRDLGVPREKITDAMLHKYLVK